MSMIDYFKNWIEVFEDYQNGMDCDEQIKHNNISLTISTLTKLFKNSYSMNFK